MSAAAEAVAELLADADGHLRELGAATPSPGLTGCMVVMPSQLLRGCYELDRDTGAVIERAPVVWRAL